MEWTDGRQDSKLNELVVFVSRPIAPGTAFWLILEQYT